MEATDNSCPHCGLPIAPKPKRAKSCPVCRNTVYVRRGKLVTMEQAKAYDLANGMPQRWMTNEDRFREFRRLAAENLQQAAELGIREVQIITTVGCCAFCRSQNGKIVPIRRGALDVLPPFTRCANEQEAQRTNERTMHG